MKQYNIFHTIKKTIEDFLDLKFKHSQSPVAAIKILVTSFTKYAAIS